MSEIPTITQFERLQIVFGTNNVIPKNLLAWNLEYLSTLCSVALKNGGNWTNGEQKMIWQA